MDFITKEGLVRLKEELTALEKRRPEVVIALNDARDQGDLSENAGYHAAKATLREIDTKMAKLQDKLPNLQVIEVKQTDTVSIGAYVKVYEEIGEKTQVMRIVGEEDEKPADMDVVYITFKSPVAKLLLNKSIGAVCELQTPAGERAYKILAISADIIR